MGAVLSCQNKETLLSELISGQQAKQKTAQRKRRKNMNTMTNKMFRKNYKDLPVAAKVLWTISASIAIIAVTMIGLEFVGVIGDHHFLEICLCNISLWTNIFIMNKYKTFIQK